MDHLLNMRNLLTVIALLLASKASAVVGPLINGNQINPQTAISIASFTVTGAGATRIQGAGGLSVTNSVDAGSVTAHGAGGITASAGPLVSSGAAGGLSLTSTAGVGNTFQVLLAQDGAHETLFFGQAWRYELFDDTLGTWQLYQPLSNSVGMFMGSAGNLGVGTASPGSKLDVNGSGIIRGSSFTVGSSSFSVGGGSATVAYQMTAGVFSGPGTSLTGTAASLTAGHVTTNANLTGDVTSVGNATTLDTSVAHTYTGAIGLTNVALTATGANGNIVSASSITTTSGLFGASLNISGTTNLSTFTWTGNLISKTGTTTTFTGCVSGSSVSLTTQGQWVQIQLNGDAANSTINDGCYIWVLQDGVFFNSQTAAVGFAGNQSTVANQATMIGKSEYTHPAAGSHTYCVGVGVQTGGTCTWGYNVYANLAIIPLSR